MTNYSTKPHEETTQNHQLGQQGYCSLFSLAQVLKTLIAQKTKRRPKKTKRKKVFTRILPLVFKTL
jgi:hypothetical protein